MAPTRIQQIDHRPYRVANLLKRGATLPPGGNERLSFCGKRNRPVWIKGRFSEEQNHGQSDSLLFGSWRGLGFAAAAMRPNSLTKL
jgi:hypothetical protein